MVRQTRTAAARDQDRAEDAERREMFSFDPQILADAGDLPRRLDGTAYADTRPAAAGHTGRR